jgi:hypothetical protein
LSSQRQFLQKKMAVAEMIFFSPEATTNNAATNVGGDEKPFFFFLRVDTDDGEAGIPDGLGDGVRLGLWLTLASQLVHGKRVVDVVRVGAHPAALDRRAGQ